MGVYTCSQGDASGRITYQTGMGLERAQSVNEPDGSGLGSCPAWPNAAKSLGDRNSD